MHFTFNIQNEDSLRVSPFYAAIILRESDRFLLIRNFLAHSDGCWEVQVSHDRKAKGQCGTAGAFNSISKSKNIVL